MKYYNFLLQHVRTGLQYAWCSYPASDGEKRNRIIEGDDLLNRRCLTKGLLQWFARWSSSRYGCFP